MTCKYHYHLATMHVTEKGKTGNVLEVYLPTCTS